MHKSSLVSNLARYAPMSPVDIWRTIRFFIIIIIIIIFLSYSTVDNGDNKLLNQPCTCH